MKFSMSFPIAMLLAAAPAGALPDPRPGDVYFPQPLPFPAECPEGAHRFEVLCIPDGDKPRPSPIPQLRHPREDRIRAMKDALAGDDMAAKGEALRFLWNEGGAKARVRKVQDTTWGGPTGRPPEIPVVRPQRPESTHQDPPRQSQPPAQRPTPPEIPRLPPSVIPGTQRRA